MQTPLVSIGIPTFNRPDGLKNTLSRITRQTYSNLEIIVSDNQSEDEKAVRAVVKSFSDRDPRIKFFRQMANLGSTGNFNYLLQQAKGDYFLWAADDDEVEETYVETLLAGLTANPSAAVAMTGYDVTDTMSEPPIFVDLTRHLYALTGASAFARLRSYIRQPDHLGKSRIVWGMFPRALIARAFAECLQAHVGRDAVTWADLPIDFRILSYGGLVICPKVLFHVFLLPSSDGRRGLAHKTDKLMTIAQKGYLSFCAAVETAALSEEERAELLRMLRRKYRKDKLQLYVYYGVIGRFPRLARGIKTVFYRFA